MFSKEYFWKNVILEIKIQLLEGITAYNSVSAHLNMEDNSRPSLLFLRPCRTFLICPDAEKVSDSNPDMFLFSVSTTGVSKGCRWSLT